METPSILLGGLGREAEQAMRTTLQDVGHVAEVTRSCDASVSAFETMKPGAVLLNAEGAVAEALTATAAIAAAGGRVGILGPSRDADLILRCMRAGAREFAIATDENDVRRAVRALLSAQLGRELGRVVTLFPAKGGVGTTSVATNVAGAIAARGQRVCVVDIDRYFGDVLSFLDLTARYTIAEVLANLRRLDADLLDASLARHASGVFVLTHGDKVEEAERVRSAELQSVLRFMRQHYDWIVVDGIHTLDDGAMGALDASDRILLVLTPDVPAVRNAQRAVELLHSAGYEEHKVSAILNRSDKGAKVNAAVITETTGISIAAAVANDYPTLSRAVNTGVLVADAAPQSRIARDLSAVAQLVTGVRGPARAGWLSGLFRRKGASDAA